MIDRVRLNDLRDMIHTLCNFDILESTVVDSYQKKNLLKKEAQIILKVDLEELSSGLKDFN
jgi:hypothetical protein